MLNENKTDNNISLDIDFNSLPHMEVTWVVLPFFSKVKNLGIIFNCNLNWNDTADDICKTGFPVYIL